MNRPPQVIQQILCTSSLYDPRTWTIPPQLASTAGHANRTTHSRPHNRPSQTIPHKPPDISPGADRPLRSTQKPRTDRPGARITTPLHIVFGRLLPLLLMSVLSRLRRLSLLFHLAENQQAFEEFPDARLSSHVPAVPEIIHFRFQALKLKDQL